MSSVWKKLSLAGLAILILCAGIFFAWWLSIDVYSSHPFFGFTSPALRVGELSSTGSLLVISPDQKSTKADSRTLVLEGQTLTSGTGTSIMTYLPDGSFAYIYPNSSLLIKKLLVESPWYTEVDEIARGTVIIRGAPITHDMHKHLILFNNSLYDIRGVSAVFRDQRGKKDVILLTGFAVRYEKSFAGWREREVLFPTQKKLETLSDLPLTDIMLRLRDVTHNRQAEVVTSWRDPCPVGAESNCLLRKAIWLKEDLYRAALHDTGTRAPAFFYHIEKATVGSTACIITSRPCSQLFDERVHLLITGLVQQLSLDGKNTELGISLGLRLRIGFSFVGSYYRAPSLVFTQLAETFAMLGGDDLIRYQHNIFRAHLLTLLQRIADTQRLDSYELDALKQTLPKLGAFWSDTWSAPALSFAKNMLITDQDKALLSSFATEVEKKRLITPDKTRSPEILLLEGI